MSLIDVVREKYETPVGGSKGSKRSKSPLKNLKELKEPRPNDESLQLAAVTNDELKTDLEDDWDEVSNDPAQLEVARLWVTEAKQVAAGVIPERYTQTSNCKFCGPVLVCDGYPLKAKNCPWCFNRIKGLQIPKGNE